MLSTLVPLLVMALAADQPLGSLVIVGGGKMPDAVRAEFIRLAGGAKNAKIIVIPTASADADDTRQNDSFLKPWIDAGVKNVQLLHTRDRKMADGDEFLKPLTNATGVWMSGGDQTRLAKAYLGTKTLDSMKTRYRSGAVAGGTSAGAAVMSDFMITGGTITATTDEGFGFLKSCVVDQHFTQRKREARLAGVLKAQPKLLGIGIDESTAIVVQNDQARVQGSGQVYFSVNGQQSGVSLKSGEGYDLSGRQQSK
jgi:cyanophycinase